MQFIRSILFALFLVVFTPIWSVLCMLAFPFLSPENRYTFIGLWNKIVIALLKPLCGIHYEIRGMENMQAVLNEPGIQSRIRALGLVPAPSSPEAFAEQIRRDHLAVARLVKLAGIEPQ